MDHAAEGNAQCCTHWLCPLGQHVFHHNVAPCPALEHDGTRHWCGLVRSPDRYMAEVPWWLVALVVLYINGRQGDSHTAGEA